MIFHIITIFPKVFDCYFNESIIKRAQKKGLVRIKIHDLRDYSVDKHKTADDKPYGGGPGMVLKVEPIWKCVQKLKANSSVGGKKTKIILLSAKGERFDQAMAKKIAKSKRLILICGHYEGVDERVAKYIADQEISVGEYILTGGEIPAMIMVDAVTRLLPGVLGKKESLLQESFSAKGYLEYPQYTRPEIFKRWKVPEALLSGNHKKIGEWKSKHSKIKKI